MSNISLSNFLQAAAIQGTSGSQGTTGEQGIQGTRGTQGITGSQGEQGIQGFQGAGEQGIQGIQGTQGITGSQGTIGTQGASNVPSAGASKTSSYTLETSDVGDFVTVSTGGSITIPNDVFNAGDVIVVFNDTTGNITITCSITTAYIGGTNSDKASVTLATRGIATILFISGTVCVITGNVS